MTISAAGTNSGMQAPPRGHAHTRKQVRSKSSDAFENARRHSRRVRMLKFALPVAAILMIGFFAGLAWLASGTGFAVNILRTGIENGKLVMANPKLDGFTKENLPYSMRALKAIQDISNTNVITLETIDASVPVNSELTATIDAKEGVFDNAANTLDINSPFTVTTNDGMIAKLESAFIDVQSGDLKTEKPVDIEKDGSRILADSMTITERGKILVFENRVRLTIKPDQLKKARESQREK